MYHERVTLRMEIAREVLHGSVQSGIPRRNELMRGVNLSLISGKSKNLGGIVQFLRERLSSCGSSGTGSS